MAQAAIARGGVQAIEPHQGRESRRCIGARVHPEVIPRLVAALAGQSGHRQMVDDRAGPGREVGGRVAASQGVGAYRPGCPPPTSGRTAPPWRGCTRPPTSRPGPARHQPSGGDRSDCQSCHRRNYSGCPEHHTTARDRVPREARSLHPATGDAGLCHSTTPSSTACRPVEPLPTTALCVQCHHHGGDFSQYSSWTPRA